MKLVHCVALTLALLLTGCGGGGGGSTGNDVVVVATGIAVSQYDQALASLDPCVYFLASEFAQAGLDLNGDGDAADNVVYMVDTTTRTVSNLGFAARLPIVSADALVGWITPEVAQGAGDATGDGDFADQVLVVHDPLQPPSVSNPRVTGANVSDLSPLVAFGGFFAFATEEFEMVAAPVGPPLTPPYPIGIDLNADGDFDDIVIRIYDVATDSVINTGLAWAGGAFRAKNGLITFIVSELQNGDQDLNGDGDTADLVLFAFDTRNQVLGPVGPSGSMPRAIDPTVVEVCGPSTAPVIAYAIDEAAEGMTSLNYNPAIGDTDAADYVIAIFDVNTQTEYLPYQGIAIDPFQIAISETHVVFVARETENGTGTLVDFNSDGDTDDEVPFWAPLAAPTLAVNTGIASVVGEGRIQVCADYFLLMAEEADQGAGGTNYNATTGDEDRSDRVPFFIYLSAPGTPGFNTQIASTEYLCYDGFFVIIGDEAANDGFDFAEDGDSNDLVPIFFRSDGPVPVRGSDPIVTDGVGVIQVCPSYIRLFANAAEDKGFGDVNQDGDEDDHFLNVTRISRASGEVLNNQWLFTTDDDGSSVPFVAGPRAVFFPFLEQTVSTGLNANQGSGDVDLSDRVLYWVSTTCQ